MSEMFVKSTDINVFPTAYRNDYDPGSKFFSEENIGNILNSIIDHSSIAGKQGFVVGSAKEVSDGDYILFNLHGYWFRLKFNESSFSNWENIYAYINISADTWDSYNKKIRYANLKNLKTSGSDENLDDSSAEFNGLELSDTLKSFEENVEGYQLLLLSKDSSTSKWSIPATSILKFNTLDILNKASTEAIETDPVNIRTKFETKDLIVENTLTANGAATFENTLTANGAATFNDTLTANGAATFNDTLTANGAATFNDTLTANGAATFNNTLTCAQQIKATSFYATSDKRLKENIVDYTPENSILDLPIKEFDFKSDGSHHIGCIAQDLQKICPELVQEDKDGYLSIEESKLIYLLLNEVKLLKAEVEELKEKVK